MAANSYRCAILVALALLLAAGAVRAEEERPEWAGDLAALLAERVPARRAERLDALLARAPDPRALLAELGRPPVWAGEAKVGRLQWEREVAGGSRLTVFAFVPSNYTHEKAWPVLVWMHGGVSRAEDGGGLSGIRMLEDAAEAGGFLLLSPSATGNCVWWSPAGVEHLRGALREFAATHRIDPARIAAAGFSDGGSGCYHLLAHDPEPYGCFLALMGNPLVTTTAGGPLFPSNLASRPVLAWNGGLDPLYPSERMKPIVEEWRAAGASIDWEDFPEAGHDPTAAMEQWEKAAAFWTSHPRPAPPAKVDWTTAAPGADGRRAWVEILEVDPAAPSDETLAVTPMPVPEVRGRPRLGISIDQSHPGPGIRVDRVEPGTPAAEAGFQPGDTIQKVGETTLASGEEGFRALRAYLEGLGDTDGTFEVERAGEKKTLTARPRVLPQDAPPKALGYGRPAGRVVAEVVSPTRVEVRSRAVKRFRLHLAPPLFDPSQELLVLVNGKEAFRGKPGLDALYILDLALRSLPGDPVAVAELVVTP
jgi:poly(3-hydroxybutyrate) depolymerase